MRAMAAYSSPCTNNDLKIGLVVKRTGCFSRGPEFNSWHPHGGSKPSTTSVPGDQPLLGTAGTWYTNVHMDKTPIHIKQTLKNIHILSHIIYILF